MHRPSCQPPRPRFRPLGEPWRAKATPGQEISDPVFSQPPITWVVVLAPSQSSVDHVMVGHTMLQSMAVRQQCGRCLAVDALSYRFEAEP